jgi:hypothetical protein
LKQKHRAAPYHHRSAASQEAIVEQFTREKGGCRCLHGCPRTKARTASPCCRVQPRIIVFRVAGTRSLFLTKGVVRPQLLITGDTSLPCLLAIAPIRRGRRVKITSLRATVQLVLTAKDIACPLCPLLMVLQSREQMGKDKETMLLSFPRCIYWMNSGMLGGKCVTYSGQNSNRRTTFKWG